VEDMMVVQEKVREGIEVDEKAKKAARRIGPPIGAWLPYFG
jgi:hypothetical protein